jgi:hypothetical protein
MKIYNNDQILKNLYPETTDKTMPTSGKEFGAVLKETVEDTKKAEPATQQMKLLNPLSGVHLNPRLVQDKAITIERIEKMIDLLDQYRQMLADPKVSLRKMDPVVMEMAREKEKMATALDSLQDGEELKNILNQTLVTASLEISKFYRGDYIAS